MTINSLYRKSVARRAALILLETGCILFDPESDTPFRVNTSPLRHHPNNGMELMDMLSDLPEHDGSAPGAPLLALTSWEDILEVMHLNDFGDRVMRQALALYIRGDDENTSKYDTITPFAAA